nr:uncharacterized protein LOC113724609 [Coffea arabica]
MSHKPRKQMSSDTKSDDDNSDVDAAPDSDSDIGSDRGSDEEKSLRPLVFDPKDENNPKIKLRQIFSFFKELKEAIRTWNIRRERSFKFIKSDNIRVRAICPKDGCDWCIYARRMKGDGRLEVRTFQKKHKYGFSYHNKSVKFGWVGRRAKKIAENLGKGSEMDQFNKLPYYINEIERSNPGSTVIMKLVDDYCDAVTGQGKFQRLYMCFAGVKQGFLAACRPVFGLDGTFFKGSAGGVLLTAVGVDPNNRMYPIAYAATEEETKDSWIWFLTLLKKDLKIERDYE